MKVAVAQINTTVGDFPGNREKILAAIERGRESGADLVVLPEMAVLGYPAEDFLENGRFVREALASFRSVVAATRGISAVIGTIRPSERPGGKPLCNSAALVRDGEVLLLQDKTLLPTYDVFDEGRYFEPAREHHVVGLGSRRIGLTVCEDMWNDESFWDRPSYRIDPVSVLVGKGADLIINASSSPFRMGKPRLRKEMVTSVARRHGVDVVYANLVGGNTTLIFDGHSLVADRQGRLLAALAGFEEAFEVVDLDRPAPAEVAGGGEVSEVSEAYDALVLGTRDYMAKCGFQRAVLGLSGGIDSSLTAAIAAASAGPENVLGVAMPSRYSSPGSVSDARDLAANLGIDFVEIPIEGVFTSALSALEPVLRGHSPDVTEENIQARIRGMILMAISNKLGALLLATGNKSELAVGYCTLYGDMCGGLGVLADVPKTLVYGIARHLNRDREMIPLSVLSKAPSAELRPDQTDQDTLPAYETLDRILEEYIEARRDQDEIQGRMKDVPPGLIADVLRMVDRCEFKRKQAAPGLKITSKAFGPGRRIPVVQRYR